KSADVSVEIDKKTKIRLAIKELDRILKKDNNQMDKGVSSLIDDKRISMKIMSYLRSYKFSVNSKEWLRKLRWECKEWKKYIYVDRHEQEDIVQYRQTVFLPMMKELEPVLIEYDDKNLTKLVEKNIPPEKKQYCVITYDKTMLVANNDEKTR
ncbi:13083_t:CDS:2, partial [Dentiscutata heterogama]